MVRKRRRPTPGFNIPNPFNPIQGEQANLRQDGTTPFCAMFQIAAADIYENYVICRGFDPRILKFIDYAAGNADKPGISVAKPFGKRTIGRYTIGEIYPAFLPTQGNTEFSGFKHVTFVPPSPVAVDWRLGQNPGVADTVVNGGHPASLAAGIDLLVDHNNTYINWLLIDGSGGGGGASIEYVIDSLRTAGAEDEPYTGLIIATVTIHLAPCDRSSLIGTSVDVVDHSRCIFDLPEADLLNVWGWAGERIALSLDPLADPGELTPCHWSADDRCCVASEVP